MPADTNPNAVIIADASALGALICGEPEAATVAEKLSGGVVAAPALVWFELAGVCREKCSRYPDHRAAVLQAFGLSHRLPIRIIEIDHVDSVRLAEETGLTTCDASYLWLCRKLDGALVTLDKTLEKPAITLDERK